MGRTGDIGVLPPLGVYDPLGLIETRDMRRYEIMEIKHGRELSNLHLNFSTHKPKQQFQIQFKSEAACKAIQKKSIGIKQEIAVIIIENSTTCNIL